MPFKTKNSPYWKVRKRRLRGWGDTGTLSTGTKSQRLAENMEACIQYVYEKGLEDQRWWSLLDALRPLSQGRGGRLTLAEMYAAKTSGELEQLLVSLHSPSILDAVEEFLRTKPPYQIRNGLKHILRLVPEKVNGQPTRLSYLESPQNIRQLFVKAESQGLKRSSISRLHKPALSKLIAHHSGKAKRDAVFAEVDLHVPMAKPRPFISAAEIVSLIKACEDVARSSKNAEIWQLPLIAKLSLQTSADRGVVLRLQPKDFQVVHEGNETGAIVHLRGTKAKTRNRVVIIEGTLTRELMPLLESKEPYENIFTLTGSTVNYYYEKARQKASLEHVRFKDLRHAFGKHGRRAGLSAATLKGALGHSNQTMTEHYAETETEMTLQDAKAVAKSMGLYLEEHPLRMVETG